MGLGLLAIVGVLDTQRAYAGENHQVKKCSLATLNGQYVGAADGMLIPPVPLFSIPAGAPPSVTRVAGFSIYNGDGTGMAYVTFTVDGSKVNVNPPIPFTYTLKPDCTGTRADHNGPHFDIYAPFDGSGVSWIATDLGFAVAGFDKRTETEEEQ